MLPRDFLEQVVRPNILDMKEHYSDLRIAFNAIHAVDALAAHIFHAGGSHECYGAIDDTEYREKLACICSEFRLLRDAAKSIKHVKLTRGTPIVGRVDQIESRPMHLFFGPDGKWDNNGRWNNEARWDGEAQIVVDLGNRSEWALDSIVTNGLALLEIEMVRLGISQ